MERNKGLRMAWNMRGGMTEITELKTRSACLIPLSDAVTCHEYAYCKCDINWLLEEITQLKEELKKAYPLIELKAKFPLMSAVYDDDGVQC